MSVLGADRKLLTCVLPRGEGLALVRRLADERGVFTAAVHSARGLVGSDPGAVFNRVEKDVLTVAIDAGEADELFLWIHAQAEVATRPGRFLYLAPLRGATPFALPADMPWEER